VTPALPEAVVWHDVECGGYDADLPLWRELAEAAAGDILDVGAGTGRVTLDLLRRGHAVTALDRDAELLEEVRRRAARVRMSERLSVVRCDARAMTPEGRFALILVPMQTVQLLGGPDGRAGFLAGARARLEPGGLLAAALADELHGFDAAEGFAPAPDVREVAGVVYASRPVALRDEGASFAIERVRETLWPGGHRTSEDDLIRLDRLDAATLAEEARATGLCPEAPRRIAETEEHVGSVVVMLRG
jgi:precorrin-6B methylase 2